VQDATRRPSPGRSLFASFDDQSCALSSVDLGASAEITTCPKSSISRGTTWLLKAALIASGLVRPEIEGSEQSLPNLLGVSGRTGQGIELVSNVNNFPKGSRLGVSPICCVPDFRLHAATGQAQASPAVVGKRTPPGRGPRDSGRMGRRFRRRLAGQRRRLAGINYRGPARRRRRPGSSVSAGTVIAGHTIRGPGIGHRASGTRFRDRRGNPSALMPGPDARCRSVATRETRDACKTPRSVHGGMAQMSGRFWRW